MSVVTDSLGALLPATITTIVCSGIAFILSSYFNSNIASVIAIFALCFFYTIHIIDLEKRAKKQFAALKIMEVNKSISELFWQSIDVEIRMEWLSKVSENAPPSEMKHKYQRLLETTRYWEKEKEL